MKALVISDIHGSGYYGEKIKEIRSITGLSQAKFSNEYHIPLKTLTQWEQNCAKCPDYVIELLEFKVKYDYSR